MGRWRGDIDKAPPPHLVAAGIVPIPGQVHYSTLTPLPTGVAAVATPQQVHAAAVAVPQQVHALRPAVKPPPPMLHAVYMTNQQANRGCHPVGCGHVHAHFVNKI